MNFEEKCSIAVEELKKAKIWRTSYNPPIIRLMHKLGYQIPFPHYNSFLKNFIFTGSLFGLFWGLVMHFFIWNALNIPLNTLVMASLGAGASSGFIFACYYSFSFKRYQLTPWNDIK